MRLNAPRYLFTVSVLLFFVFGGSAARGQSYLASTGQPKFAVPIPVEMGFTDASNGNLHIEIPLGSFPQRGSGQAVAVALIYDSSFWQAVPDGASDIWYPNTASGLWRLVPNGNASTTIGSGVGCLTEFQYTDDEGTSRYFAVPVADSTSCPGTGNAFAADSSGYRIYVTNFTPGQTYSLAVYAPDGTLVSGTSIGGTNCTRTSGTVCPVVEDTNGNYLSFDYTNNNYIDTLGRTVVHTVVGCTGFYECYSIPNSQFGLSAGTSTYGITWSVISYNTDFGETGVTDHGGSLGVIQSITLPGGAGTYSFKYDCDSSTGNAACGSPHGQAGYYGTLTSMTLPTGGQVTYGYTTFSDSYGNKTEWLSSKTSPGGNASYVPQVLTNCTATQVGCKMQVTATAASGAATVYTLYLDNGAWPIETQTYNGPVSGPNLFSTVNDTYDFTQPCPLPNCIGHAFIRKSSETLTQVGAGGASLTKQTKYTYDSPQTGNITGIMEWRFLPGSAPSFPITPDRATYTSYLSTGTNDINRPLSVTLCSNSGTNSYCTGGGSPVTQTLYAYDGYGPGGLTLMNGTSNHDDTDFGVTFTARGNPTKLSNWVSGSQYLNTSLSYDTTGQITQTSDPKANITTYGYADKFYSDNGANPPSSYTPTAPTNAYVTSVTSVLGTENLGYYYGSGNQTFYSDLNAATTYSHFVDPFDRQTENVFPIGWSLTAYPSLTETDVYNSVADAAASTGCSSCQHLQYLLDDLGRESSRKLVNNPIGAVRVDTAYDISGRVLTISHPYVSGPVNETFSYDSLDRTTQVNHPDSQKAQALYGATITGASQQGSTTTYGYGYPVLGVDEAGKGQMEWVDGFGRKIEVDQGVVSSPGTQATGWILFGAPPQGSFSVAVGTFQANFTIPVNQSSQVVAQAVSSALNGSGLVTTTLSGSEVLITSIVTGIAGDYPMSVSGITYSISGSSLTGGGSGTSSSQAYTTYLYDAADHLTQVVQGSQTRSFTYDGLGRVVQEVTPEAGTVTFSFTTSGSPCGGDPDNICSKTDARGLTTNYSYDTANRLSSRSNSAGTSTYTYDQGGAAAHALGRLTKLTDPSGSETYTYDANGRTTAVVKVVGTSSYPTSYQYLGGTAEITQVTYPSGRVVQQGYNEIGQLCAVAGQTSATSCTSPTNPYATGYTYNALGEATGYNYGNGVVAAFSYSTQRSQLSSISFTKGTTKLLSLNYWYQQASPNCVLGTSGNNGQIQCITDNVDSGRNVTYTYDSLFRLTGAKTAGSASYPQWGVSETYDEYGNRWTQAVTAGTAPTVSLSFGSAGMNSSTTNRPNGYTYDASGNLTVEPLTPANNYTYDANNRLVSFSGGGGTANYTYDDNGMRVVKTANGTTTVSIYSGSGVIAEYDNGAAPTSPSREYIYADSESGAQLIGMISGATIEYFHPDHLSVRAVSSSTGSLLGQQGHYPFGENWYQTNTTTKWMFTSYDRDSESGLDYALARYYDNRTAAFCSADPLEGTPEDPQSWNRYAYVENDPINLVDPSGKSLLTDVLEALSIVLDAWTGGGATEILGEVIQISNLASLTNAALIGKSALQQTEGKQNTQPSPPLPSIPQGNGKTGKTVNCGSRNISITVVGGNQGQGKGAFTHKPINIGEVAIDPTDYGYDDYYELAGQINPAKGAPNSPQYPNSQTAMQQLSQEQAELKNAHITITPTSPLPKGLPSQGPFTAADAIHPPHDNGVDVYRTKTKKEALKLGRISATANVSYTPSGRVHCLN